MTLVSFQGHLLSPSMTWEVSRASPPFQCKLHTYIGTTGMQMVCPPDQASFFIDLRALVTRCNELDRDHEEFADIDDLLLRWSQWTDRSNATNQLIAQLAARLS